MKILWIIFALFILGIMGVMTLSNYHVYPFLKGMPLGAMIVYMHGTWGRMR